MTGDELMSAIYAEQGYVVWCTSFPKQLGMIEDEYIDGHREVSTAKTPVRYVAKSSRGEYKKQLTLVRRLIQDPSAQMPEWAHHFYRVEAAG